ncbi:MAG: hypothetical protein U0235_23435 [Polyangiaceae bacterium]
MMPSSFHVGAEKSSAVGVLHAARRFGWDGRRGDGKGTRPLGAAYRPPS